MALVATEIVWEYQPLQVKLNFDSSYNGNILVNAMAVRSWLKKIKFFTQRLKV